MLNYAIRNARKADAYSMAQFAANGFEQTFGLNYDPQDLKNFLCDNYNQTSFSKDIESPEMLNLLAINANEEIIGFAQCGPMKLPLEGAIKASCELYRLYVSEAAKGSGLAHALLGQVIEFARKKNSRALYLGVWSKNERALAFYRRAGFEIIGKYLYQVGKTFDDERIMQLFL